MGYISVRHWRKFQHYDPAKRVPPWIKNHTELMAKDEYLSLTFVQRGVLHGIWMEYSTARCQLPDSTLGLSRRLGGRVTRATLEALNHAGFIDFVASAPLAEGYHVASTSRAREEVEVEKETEGRIRTKNERPRDFSQNLTRNIP